MSNATTKFQVSQYLSNGGFFANFMPVSQRFVLRDLLNGEEGNHIAEILIALKHQIENMPKTYETDKIECKEKIVHLHYFRGGVDAWIVERDVGDTPDGDGLGEQLQAFGMQSFGGLSEAEWGYVSIRELIENGVELDLYFEPKKAKELK